jgi:D-alanyl-D-alanine carboxypeptidase
VAVCVVAVGQPSHASALAPAPTSTTSTTSTTVPPAAKAELLVDAATGRVLFGQNEHLPLPPGSLTKLLTAMIVSDWLPPNTAVPISARAAAASPDRVGMKAGQRWPLVIALRTLLVFSGNDAAYALAERVGGSLARFAVIMRLAARELGLSDPLILRDPAGLDGREGFEGGNLLSAWDVAIAARDLMANPTLASIVALKHYRFTGPDHVVYDLSNKNRYFLDTYPGAIGIKTGLTDRAGFCVAEEAVRGRRALLAVVMHGANSYQTAADLLDRGFAMPAAAERNDPILPPVREPEPAAPPAPHASPTRAAAAPAPRAQVRMPANEAEAAPGPGGAGAVAAQPPGSSPVPVMAGVAGTLAFAAVVGAGAGYGIRRRYRRRRRSPDSSPP